nr:GNAT family N-acetyltransferase [Muricauda sp. CAU 1633]
MIAEADHNDADFIVQLLNSQTWLKFIGDKGVKTKKQALSYIDESLVGSYKKNGFGLYKLCLQSSLIPIGLCGFLQRDYLDHPDIGFALLPEFEGQGFMFEACHALMNHAESALKLECVSAIVLPTNGKSCRLLEKIGLQEIGTIKQNTGGQELLLFSNKKNPSTKS